MPQEGNILIYFLAYLSLSSPSWCANKISPEPRIIGGEPAISHEFPHHVILIAEDDESIQTCGGTIVTPDYILTAAHCADKKSAGNILIVAGLHIISANETTRQRSRVVQVFVHPCYTSDTSNPINDIALLKLGSPFSFDQFVGSIPLDGGDMAKPGINATVMGWGRTDPERRGSSSDVLKKANLEILTEDECKNAVRSFSPESQICAFNSDGYACNGDSGGPLLCKENGRNYICGIASFAVVVGCVGAPSGYTRVSHFKTWINEVIENGRESTADCVKMVTRNTYLKRQLLP